MKIIDEESRRAFIYGLVASCVAINLERRFPSKERKQENLYDYGFFYIRGIKYCRGVKDGYTSQFFGKSVEYSESHSISSVHEGMEGEWAGRSEVNPFDNVRDAMEKFRILKSELKGFDDISLLCFRDSKKKEIPYILLSTLWHSPDNYESFGLQSDFS